MNRGKVNQILHIVTIALLLMAVAVNKNGRIAGHTIGAQDADTAVVAEVAEVVTAKASTNGDTITLSSAGVADKVIGYAGRTPVEIKLVGGKIARVVALPNDESPRYFESVIESGLLDRWKGLTIEEAVNEQVDAVSGATYSSTAVIKSVNLTLAKYAADSAPSPLRGLLSWKLLAVLLVIASAVVMPFVLKNKTARTIQLALNVLVIGVWSHSFISMSLIVNSISNGFDLATGVIPAILLIIGFAFPLFGKSNHYCNWVCPLGSLQELVGKPLKRKPRMSDRLVKWLGHVREALWIAILLVMLTGSAFEIMDYEVFSIFMFNQASTAVVVMGCAFIVLSVFVPRPYCRFVCPTGSIMKYAQSNK